MKEEQEGMSLDNPKLPQNNGKFTSFSCESSMQRSTSLSRKKGDQADTKKQPRYAKLYYYSVGKQGFTLKTNERSRLHTLARGAQKTMKNP
jgi:hypothetical protein